MFLVISQWEIAAVVVMERRESAWPRLVAVFIECYGVGDVHPSFVTLHFGRDWLLFFS